MNRRESLAALAGLGAAPPAAGPARKQPRAASPGPLVVVTDADGKTHTYPVSVFVRITSADGIDFGWGRRDLRDFLAGPRFKPGAPVTLVVEQRFGQDVLTEIRLGPEPTPWKQISGKLETVVLGK